MPNLVIVDMQNWFLEEMQYTQKDKLVQGVCDAVNIFKKNNHPIIALQYRVDHGFDLYQESERMEHAVLMGTHPYILDTIGDYDKFHVKWKHDDCGSVQVKNCIRKHKYDGNVYLCGVNAAACVMATWIGLTKRGHTFIAKAINEITKNVWDFNDDASKYIEDVVKYDKVVQEIDG